MPARLSLRRLRVSPRSVGSIALLFIAIILSSGGYPPVEAKPIKDTISQLSFSHDGKRLLFDRCREGDCQIQVYDLATGELSAYRSPSDERWTMARYSYDGKKIVFSIIPIRKDDSLDLGDMQIAVMDPDGKNIRKITTGPGAKIYPVFSHSGTKVLYARAAYIREDGGTPAAQFDAWEVDLATGKEKRLTYFKFFSMSNLTYFPDDERFIFYGTFPEAYPGIKDRDQASLTRMQITLAKKGMAFAGIQVMRGTEMMPKPYLFADNVLPSNPLLSKDGTCLLFEGKAQQYYLYSPDGNHRLVGGGGSVNSAAISPDGELLGVIYANWIITIYQVQDGSSRWISLAEQPPNRVYGRIQSKSVTTLPEKPVHTVNR